MKNSRDNSVRPSGWHPRNRHQGRYDFVALVQSSPALSAYVRPNPVGTATIDFADPAAVRALNRALLRHDYGVTEWELPAGFLCPPVPSRADYIHHVADLLAEATQGSVPRGAGTVVLDLGVGANCIYPLVGTAEYGWRFVGTEIDPDALAAARHLLRRNPGFETRVELRLQSNPAHLFKGVIPPHERFLACVCNPPFHSSAAEASQGTRRKLRNLTGRNSLPEVLNFGGRPAELWCAGGEAGFIRRMITESRQRPELCSWFTVLVSKRESLAAVEGTLSAARVTEWRVLPMSHGQKVSRILAWRFAPVRPLERRTVGRG